MRLVCDVEKQTEFFKLKQTVKDKGLVYLTVTEFKGGLTDFKSEGKTASFVFYGGSTERDTYFVNSTNKDEWNYTRDYVFGDSPHRELLKLNRVSGELTYITSNGNYATYVHGSCEKAKGEWKKF